MNRYTAQGMIRDAERGKNVLFVAHIRDVRAIFGEIEHMLDPEFVRQVTGSLGRERITMTSGGSITFGAYETRNYRGFTADVVCIDSALGKTQDLVDDALASLACTHCGELIYG